MYDITFKDIEERLNLWIPQMAYFVALGTSSLKYPYRLDQVSEMLGLRYFIGWSILKMQVVQVNYGDDLVLGSYTNDPFVFTIAGRNEIFNEYEEIEQRIRVLFNWIKIEKCYHCQNRLWVTKINDVLTCRNCSSMSENYGKKIIPGYVYIYGNIENQTYKIGHSKNPEIRVKSFEIQLPFVASLIHTFPSTNGIESEHVLHDKFSKQRMNGEWFSLSRKDIDYLCSIKIFKNGEFITSD